MTNEEHDPRETQEWMEADQWFNEAYSTPVFSFFGVAPKIGYTTEELTHQLEQLLEGFPVYYPAWFQLGLYKLSLGNITEGDAAMDKAFQLMGEIVTDEEEFQKRFSFRLEVLVDLYRFDLAVKYLENAIKRFPETATFYDDIAYYSILLPDGDLAKAMQYEKNAMEIDPDNDIFLSNAGWLQMISGNHDEAAAYFQNAIDYNYQNIAAADHLEIAEYLIQHNMTYTDYLLRPIESEYIENPHDDYTFEEIAERVRLYNADRLEAFKLSHLKSGPLSPHENYKTVQVFSMFMDIQEEAETQMENIFLNDDLKLLNENAKDFLLRFLDAGEYVDEILLTDIHTAFGHYYQFLAQKNLVEEAEYKAFLDQFEELKKWVSPKLEEFYEIRENVTYNDNQREEKFEQLFGEG